MSPHVCPWWGGYFIDNRFRRLFHKPEKILASYVQQGMTVMDFGCGMGLFSIAMAGLVGEGGCVIAVDVQQEMLDVLQERAEQAGVADRIRTHLCEPDTLGIDGPVDVALAFWSAHEVPDLRGLLADVHGCLVDGGKFLVAEPKGHVSAGAFAKMVALAQQVGLSVQDEPRVRFSRAVAFVKA
jgi:cyclopropane fatty-acyl-phospholipid synthase-like methyltransferase